MSINLLITIITILTCGAAVTATIVFHKKDKIDQALISIMAIGVIGVCSINSLHLLFAKYARLDTSAESMSPAVYEIEKDADGTFYYKDLETNQIVHKNTKDNDVVMSYTLAHRPVINQGYKRWGFLYTPVTIYCSTNYEDYEKYDKMRMESYREQIIDELREEGRLKK